jgi:mono/diheme cytochrome c family protein
VRPRKGNRPALLVAVFGLISFEVILAVSFAARPPEHYKYKEDSLVYAELSKVPPKDRDRLNPLAHDKDAVAGGANLYDQHCSDCHGDSGEGSRKGPSLLKPPVQTATPGTLFWVLTNGVVRRGMPVWSKLPEPQRWQLVAFIKAMGTPRTSQVVPEDQQSAASAKTAGR